MYFCLAKRKQEIVLNRHSRTKDIKQHTLQADIIVAALGQPGFLKADMVKEGVVVIDVEQHMCPTAPPKADGDLEGRRF